MLRRSKEARSRPSSAVSCAIPVRRMRQRSNLPLHSGVDARSHASCPSRPKPSQRGHLSASSSRPVSPHAEHVSGMPLLSFWPVAQIPRGNARRRTAAATGEATPCGAGLSDFFPCLRLCFDTGEELLFISARSGTRRKVLPRRAPPRPASPIRDATGAEESSPRARTRRAPEKSKTTSTALQLRSQQLANGK